MIFSSLPSCLRVPPARPPEPLVLCGLARGGKSPCRAGCFAMLCGALRAGSREPVAVSCGALRCFAGWVVGASRRLMPGALLCFAVLCGLGRGGQSPSHARCFAVLCGALRAGSWGSSRRLVPRCFRCFAVLCGLGRGGQSASRARCFAVLCGALRAGSWGPVAVSSLLSAQFCSPSFLSTNLCHRSHFGSRYKLG